MNNKFTKNQIKTMFQFDSRKAFSSPLFYIMLGISFIIPILILVMTTMMDGSISINPQTGEETIIEGFKNVWQIIGSNNMSGTMDITSMCNINMMYFVIAIFVCIFIAEDFRSGYSKNLFTIRSNRNVYIRSKTLIGIIAGASMMIAFFMGSILGGIFSGLSFTLDGITIGNIICSMLSKIFLVSIFVAIFTLAGIISKEKLWLSILLSLGIGMLFFTMIPIISPITSTFINVILTLIGGGLFTITITFASSFIFNKENIL